MNKACVKRRTKTDVLLELLALTVVWLIFMKSAISESSHVLLTGIGVICGTVLLLLCLRYQRVSRAAFAGWIYIAAAGCINICFTGTLTIQNYVTMLFLYYPAAVYVFSESSPHLIWWDASYYLYGLYIIYRMLNAVRGYYMFYAESRNSLSVLLLVWLFILYFIHKKAGKDLSFASILLFAAGCFVANGRAGIISAGLMMGAYVLISVVKGKGWKRKLKIIVIAAGLFAAAFYVARHFSALFEKYLWRFVDRQSLLSTSDRFRIWKLYIDMCMDSIHDFVFGGNTFTLLGPLYNGNLHSSFFMVHACLGLAGSVFIFFCIILGILRIIQKKDYWLLALTMTFLVRGMTDRICPGKIGDICMWIVILYGLSERRMIYNNFLNPGHESCYWYDNASGNEYLEGKCRG